jgi:hypothetical protein
MLIVEARYLTYVWCAIYALLHVYTQAKLVDAQDKVEKCQSTLHDIELAYEQAQRLLTESNRIEVYMHLTIHSMCTVITFYYGVRTCIQSCSMHYVIA